MIDFEYDIPVYNGQRYEVRATGYPRDGESIIGWFNDEMIAHTKASALLRIPTCSNARVIDLYTMRECSKPSM